MLQIREAIDQHSTPQDWMEYLFAQSDRYLNEVLEERRLKRAQSSSPQTPLPSAAQEAPNYTTPTNLPKTEEENKSIRKKSNYQLGTLSSKYESLKQPSAIGYDNGGGYSYGIFQIETKHGTMKDYLNYLANNKDYQNFAKQLQDAGGYLGALSKTESFTKIWQKLAKNNSFNQSQYQFIFNQKFKPLLKNLTDINGFNLEKRHPIIKDVLFSLAVQHGQKGALELIKNATNNNAKDLNDEELINKLYDERSKVNKYLSTLPV